MIMTTFHYNNEHMKNRMGSYLAALSIMLMLAACKKDGEEVTTPSAPVNEEEVITTLELHLHSSGGSEHKHFTFSDTDGDGGNAPVITADTLSQDSTYQVELTVLNESASPVIDITEEITEEANVHQFFFQVSGANVSVSYADVDGNGMPVGINTTWVAGTPGTGEVRVTLRHQPDKTAAGVSAGDITNAGGETDLEVVFPLVVQ